MIRIFCRAADAILKETQTLTSGMTNYPEVVLTFSSDWDGFGKSAVVRAGTAEPVAVLITDNKFVIPAECLAQHGVNLNVGVSGSNGTQTIPTIWCSVGEIYEGTEVADASNVGTATQSLVDQMIAYAGACEDSAGDAAEAAAAAAATFTNKIAFTPEAVEMLIQLFEAVPYEEDQSALIAALEAELTPAEETE